MYEQASGRRKIERTEAGAAPASADMPTYDEGVAFIKDGYRQIRGIFHEAGKEQIVALYNAGVAALRLWDHCKNEMTKWQLAGCIARDTGGDRELIDDGISLALTFSLDEFQKYLDSGFTKSHFLLLLWVPDRDARRALADLALAGNWGPMGMKSAVELWCANNIKKPKSKEVRSFQIDTSGSLGWIGSD